MPRSGERSYEAKQVNWSLALKKDVEDEDDDEDEDDSLLPTKS